MKFVLTIVVVAAVVFGLTKLRQRNDADLWHEVTTR
ncbi:DLW-39 family protein [Nocardia heshunensis]